MLPEMRSGAVIYAKNIDRIAAFYSAVVGLREEARDKDHIVLGSPGFQLVVLQTPGEIASQIDIIVPPQRRSMAAIKLVFFVRSITKVRTSVAEFGGVMNSPDKEWSFQGMIVCDGLDPEGNVIQFREQAG